VFRRLVATRLDAAGLSAREIADYLGHERTSMTQDTYMAPKGQRTVRRSCAGPAGGRLALAMNEAAKG
jgi:integrase